MAMSAGCFGDADEHHVFVIGDWGGVQPAPGAPPVPADHRSHLFPQHTRGFVVGVDDTAQLRVAAQMQERAQKSRPDYVLNVGDNFYWGGIRTHCGRPAGEHVATGQWQGVFEEVYNGSGLTGQWLGVLGNHDYGGYVFTAGWDQVISYTWGAPGSTGRWFTPAQYWSTTAYYPDFSVDYYFVDTNVFLALHPEMDRAHNICDSEHNRQSDLGPDTCGPQGPESVWDCPGWFGKLWAAQMDWLDRCLATSSADWQVVVTHFPPTYGQQEWSYLSERHGIDLILAGHKHQQEVHYREPLLGRTAWVISGGGGGITSEGAPNLDGHDDMYGFMDLKLTREEIVIEAISHGGVVRSQTHVEKRYPCPSCYEAPSTSTTTLTQTSVSSSSTTSRTTETETTASGTSATVTATSTTVHRSWLDIFNVFHEPVTMWS